MSENMFNSRFVMAGWLYLAVALVGLWDAGGGVWDQLTSWLNHEQQSALALAVSSAIVGIGAPPALGFLIERTVSALLWVVSSTGAQHESRDAFRELLAGREPASLAGKWSSLSPGSAFSVFFYTCASDPLIKHAMWRRTQFYTSFVAALSMILALATIWIVSESCPWRTTVIFGSLSALLGLHAIGMLRSYDRLIAAWITTFGRQSVSQFAIGSARRREG
jgi:hypothetical protein